jgi:cytoskeletal protein RodZ
MLLFCMAVIAVGSWIGRRLVRNADGSMRPRTGVRGFHRVHPYAALAVVAFSLLGGWSDAHQHHTTTVDVRTAAAHETTTTTSLVSISSSSTTTSSTDAPTTTSTTVAPTTTVVTATPVAPATTAVHTTHTTHATPTTAAPPAPSSTSSGKGYINVDGNFVPSPVQAPSAPAGATAQCNDGSYSFSQHHSGTCSSHGGVKSWL